MQSAQARVSVIQMLEFVCEPELLEIAWVRAGQAGDTQKQTVILVLVQNLMKLPGLKPRIKAKFMAHLRRHLT